MCSGNEAVRKTLFHLSSFFASLCISFLFFLKDFFSFSIDFAFSWLNFSGPWLCVIPSLTILLQFLLIASFSSVPSFKFQRKEVSLKAPVVRKFVAQVQSLLWGPHLLALGLMPSCPLSQVAAPSLALISSLQSMTWAQGDPGDHRQAGHSSTCRYCNFWHSY